MKKFLKFLVFALIVPLCFSFAGCKKKDNNNNNNSGGGTPGIEQPVNPTPGEGEGEGSEDEPTDPENPENPDEPTDPETPDEPDEPDVPTEPEVYTVSFDYSLPADYDFLLQDVSCEKEITESVELPLITDQKLTKYFLGWFDKSTNDQVTSAVTGTADQEIKLYGKWDETNLKKYYYSDGLVFGTGVDTESNDVATIVSYSGSDETVILPIYYVENDTELAVRIISENAFRDTSVKKLVQNIEGLIVEDYAFFNSKLSTFDFSNTYTIGEYAFYNTKLENVNLSVNVRELGNYAFYNVPSLVSVDFSKVTSINKVAYGLFSGCSKLESIKLSSAMTSIESYAFENCSSLTNLNFASNVTVIRNYAFKGCVALTEVVISSKIESFGYNVFSGCTGLKYLTLDTLYVVNEYTNLSSFIGDLSATLEKIEITGTTLTEIPSRYFANYSALEEIIIPDQVETIGEYAFVGCVALKKIEFPESLNLNNFSLNAIEDTLWYKSLTDIVYINDVLFYVPFETSGDVVIKLGTTTIFEKAFYQNTNITSVTIPSSVSYIGVSAFNSCSALKSVVFEENTVLSSVSERAFYNCISLESINVTNCKNVSEFGDYSFAYLTSLETFTVPASVTKLGTMALYNCGCSSFVVETGNTAYASQDGVIYDKDLTILYYYPKNKTDKMFVVPATVTRLDNYSFAYNYHISGLYISSESMVFGDGVNSYTFLRSAGVIIYAESESLVCNALNVYGVYYLLSSENYTYKAEEDEIFVTLAEDAVITESLSYFVKITHENVDYYYILTIDVSGEIPVITEQTDISDRFV